MWCSDVGKGGVVVVWQGCGRATHVQLVWVWEGGWLGVWLAAAAGVGRQGPGRLPSTHVKGCCIVSAGVLVLTVAAAAAVFPAQLFASRTTLMLCLMRHVRSLRDSTHL